MSSSVRGLVDRFGSPLYLYELTEVEAAADGLRAALPQPSRLYYSLKANPHPWLVATLGRNGCDVEISSTGELETVLGAGIVGERCLYTGPGKTAAELAAAVRAGVRRFSVESATDYRRVADAANRHGVTVDCLVRVNAGRAAGSSGLRMTGTASSFGVDADLLCAASVRFAPVPGARVIGLHFFPLSNARDEDDVVAALLTSVAEIVRIREATGIPIEVVDLGGGFAAPYVQEGDRPAYGTLRRRVEPVLDEHLPGWRNGRPEVCFESGRYLVGGCGRLVCTVQDVKTSRGRDFVVADTGIHHLGGLSGLGRLLPMRPTVVSPAPSRAGRAGGPVSLVGPLCTPADVLARDALGDSVQVGDLLMFPNAGAYGLTASLIGFLSREPAAEVVLRDGEPVHVSRLRLRRECLDLNQMVLTYSEAGQEELR